MGFLHGTFVRGMEEGVICHTLSLKSEKDHQKLHTVTRFLFYRYGGPWQHQDRDPHHQPEGIREWIRSGRDSFWDSLFHGVWGHRDCDFVRVAYGHVVLDKYWAKHREALQSGEKSTDEVIELAFRNFLSNGYDTLRSPRH